MDEVIRAIKDVEMAEKIIEAAYREVACNPANSFGAMVDRFDVVVKEELTRRTGSFGSAQHSRRYFSLVERLSWLDFRIQPKRILLVPVLRTILPFRPCAHTHFAVFCPCALTHFAVFCPCGLTYCALLEAVYATVAAMNAACHLRVILLSPRHIIGFGLYRAKPASCSDRSQISARRRMVI